MMSYLFCEFKVKKHHFKYVLWVCACISALLVSACNQNQNCDVPNVGGAAIGGDFSLISESGETVTRDDVITKPTLVYFGYTYCPDFCPQDAANMARAADLLEEQGIDIGLLFISIDPERDTPEVLKDYTDSFHNKMIGLTGAPEQVDQAAKAYKVYYAKNEDPAYTEYLMAHSTFTYLVDKAGDYLTHFSFGTAPEIIAEKTACIMKN